MVGVRFQEMNVSQCIVPTTVCVFVCVFVFEMIEVQWLCLEAEATPLWRLNTRPDTRFCPKWIMKRSQARFILHATDTPRLRPKTWGGAEWGRHGSAEQEDINTEKAWRLWVLVYFNRLPYNVGWNSNRLWLRALLCSWCYSIKIAGEPFKSYEIFIVCGSYVCTTQGVNILKMELFF